MIRVFSSLLSRNANTIKMTRECFKNWLSKWYDPEWYFIFGANWFVLCSSVCSIKEHEREREGASTNPQKSHGFNQFNSILLVTTRTLNSNKIDNKIQLSTIIIGSMLMPQVVDRDRLPIFPQFLFSFLSSITNRWKNPFYFIQYDCMAYLISLGYFVCLRSEIGSNWKAQQSQSQRLEWIFVE